MTRTDIHAPGSPDFDPQAYRLVNVYDLNDTEPSFGGTDGQELAKAMEQLDAAGVKAGSHAWGCGHCGQTNLRYVALLVRDDVQEWIFAGQDCLAGRFLSQTKESFKALKKAAELARAKQAKKAAFLALCEQHDGLVWATYAADVEHGIEIELKEFAGQKVIGRDAKYLGTTAHDHYLASGASWGINVAIDIARKARTYGELSDKQAALLNRIAGEFEGKVADYATKIAKRAEAPAVPALSAGRQVIEGVIVFQKEEVNFFGYNEQTTAKMLVKLDNGQRVWSTQPAAIFDADKGDRVRFTATIEPKDGEADFGFAKRPSKASVLTAAVVAA